MLITKPSSCWVPLSLGAASAGGGGGNYQDFCVCVMVQHPRTGHKCRHPSPLWAWGGFHNCHCSEFVGLLNVALLPKSLLFQQPWNSSRICLTQFWVYLSPVCWLSWRVLSPLPKHQDRAPLAAGLALDLGELVPKMSTRWSIWHRKCSLLIPRRSNWKAKWRHRLSYIPGCSLNMQCLHRGQQGMLPGHSHFSCRNANS